MYKHVIVHNSYISALTLIRNFIRSSKICNESKTSWENQSQIQFLLQKTLSSPSGTSPPTPCCQFPKLAILECDFEHVIRQKWHHFHKSRSPYDLGWMHALMKSSRPEAFGNQRIEPIWKTKNSVIFPKAGQHDLVLWQPVTNKLWRT